MTTFADRSTNLSKDADAHSVSDAPLLNTVMPGLVPGIHALARGTKNVDGRDKPGHDEPPPGRRREAKLRRLARP